MILCQTHVLRQSIIVDTFILVHVLCRPLRSQNHIGCSRSTFLNTNYMYNYAHVNYIPSILLCRHGLYACMYSSPNVTTQGYCRGVALEVNTITVSLFLNVACLFIILIFRASNIILQESDSSGKSTFLCRTGYFLWIRQLSVHASTFSTDNNICNTIEWQCPKVSP